MKPMLATRGDQVPTGAGWIHEVKWDGIRALVDVTPDRVRVTTRNEKDITVGVPELQRLSDLGRDLLLDGEIVVLRSGVPSFAAIAARLHTTSEGAADRLAIVDPAILMVFDLLRADGEELISHPLSERRARLENLELADEAWQVPPTYDDGLLLRDAAKSQGLEGVISKKLSSRYHFGHRTRDWLKFPTRRTDSYLVGGFRYEVGSNARLGSVLLGEVTNSGLVFRGRVGSGIAGRAGKHLHEVLEPLVRTSSPFNEVLPRQDAQDSVWVEPRILVDVEYLELTRDGRLRHPAYRGVRTDL